VVVYKPGQIQGSRELDRLLRELPEKVAKRVSNSAMRAGAKVVASAIKANAPVRSYRGLLRTKHKVDKNRPSSLDAFSTRVSVRGKGNLRASVRSRVTSRRSDVTAANQLLRGGKASVVALAGVSERAFYARFLEYGFALVRGGSGGSRRGPGRVVGHVPAKPFIRPAYEASKNLALRVVGDRLWKGIEREARKMARKRRVKT
jgi:HK97 gp10 family phage protein